MNIGIEEIRYFLGLCHVELPCEEKRATVSEKDSYRHMCCFKVIDTEVFLVIFYFFISFYLFYVIMYGGCRSVVL